jgi:hypothetical protein
MARNHAEARRTWIPQEESEWTRQRRSAKGAKSARLGPRAWIACLLAMCFCPLAAGAEGGGLPAGVSVLGYRDWPGCYRLENRQAAAVIVPTSGARLAEFSLNGRNILFEDSSTNGLDIEVGVRVKEVEWFQWDACQTDVFKQGFGHQLDEMWLCPFRVIETGTRRAVFQSPCQPAT